MSILVDTGILLRLFVPADTACESIRAALQKLRVEREFQVTTFQNLAEFWNVSTRSPSARGGYGLPPDVVDARVRFIERRFEVITESRASFLVWRELAAKHALQGVGVHDARLVAMMICGRIDRILTLNVGDFRRYEVDGVQALSPSDLVA